MAEPQWTNPKDRFLFPKHPYHGTFTPEKLIFNANLQEFAQEAEYIAGLHSNGKISTEEAYQRLKRLWHKLKASQKLIDRDP